MALVLPLQVDAAVHLQVVDAGQLWSEENYVG